MPQCFLRSCLLVSMLTACATMAYGASAKDVLSFTSIPWELNVDAKKGAWLELKHNGKVVFSNPEALPSVDLKDDAGWLSDKAPLRLFRHNFDSSSGTLSLTLANDKWSIEEVTRFSPDGNANRVERKVNMVSLVKEPVKFHGFTFNANLPLSGKYLFPGTFFYDTATNWADPTLKNPAETLKAEWRRTGEVKGFSKAETRTGMCYCRAALVEPEPGLSELFFIDSRLDSGVMAFTRAGASLQVRYELAASGWSEPGLIQHLGTAWLEVYAGKKEDALRDALPRLLSDVGLGVPKDRPDWVKDASLFNFGADHFAGDRLDDLRTTIPARVKALGCNTVWILPVQYGTVNYCPIDYYKLAHKTGGWKDYTALIDRLRQDGIKVLQDVVPHGYGQSAAIYRGNAITDLVMTKDGDILEGRAFDYNSPAWRKYMGEVASFYAGMKVDGFRVDAPYASMGDNWRRKGFPAARPSVVSMGKDRKHGKVDEAWWNKCLAENGGEMPPLAYQRASFAAICGGLNMVASIRSAARAASPNNALLLEICGVPFTAAGDILYDFYFPLIANKLPLLPPDEFVKRLSLWLEEQKLTESPDTIRMRYSNTVCDNPDSQLIIGFGAQSSLVSLAFLAHGVPLCSDNMNQGQGEHIRHLNQLRDAIPELRRGDAFYEELKPSDPKVFAVLRRMRDKSAIGLINFSPSPVNAVVPLPPAALNFNPEEKLVLWEAFSGRKLGEGRISEFKDVKVELLPWGTAILVWRPTGEAAQPWQPNLNAVAKAAPSSVAPQLKNENGLFRVSCPAYELAIDAKTGLVKSFADGDGRTLLANCDLLSDPRSNLIPSIETSVGQEGALPLITVKYGFSGKGVVELKYLCRPEGVEVRAVSSQGGLASLLLPFSNASRYQIDSAEGMFDDWDFQDVRKGHPLNRGASTRFPLDKTALWSSSLAPLDMSRPELRLFGTDKSGATILFKQLDGSAFPDAFLKSSFDGKRGLYLLVALDGKASFELRPAATREASIQGRPHKLGELTLINESLGWKIENKHFSVKLFRGGGVIKELCAKDGNPLLENQDIFTEGGYKVGFADCRSDLETETRTWREGKSLKMLFTSELRTAALGGLMPYPVHVQIEYSFDESPNIGMLCAIKATSGSEGEPSLAWGATVAKGLSVKKSGEAAVEALATDGSSGMLISVQEESGPVKAKWLVDKSKLLLRWFDGKSGVFLPQIWQQTLLGINVGNSTELAKPQIHWRNTVPLETDGGFERMASIHSLLAGRNVAFNPYEKPEKPFWNARFSAYPEFGVGKEGTAALRMNVPDPVYCQNLTPAKLLPGKYRLKFSLKGEEFVPGGKDVPFLVAVEYWNAAGKKQSREMRLVYDKPFDWQDKNFIFEVPDEGVAPFVKFTGQGVSPFVDEGSFLLDNVALEKME